MTQPINKCKLSSCWSMSSYKYVWYNRSKTTKKQYYIMAYIGINDMIRVFSVVFAFNSLCQCKIEPLYYMPLLEPMLFQTRSTHPKTNLKYHALRNVLEVMGEFSHFQPTANPLTVKSSNLWQTCPPEPWHCWRKRAAVQKVILRENWWRPIENEACVSEIF